MKKPQVPCFRWPVCFPMSSNCPISDSASAATFFYAIWVTSNNYIMNSRWQCWHYAQGHIVNVQDYSDDRLGQIHGFDNLADSRPRLNSAPRCTVTYAPPPGCRKNINNHNECKQLHEASSCVNFVLFNCVL